MRINMGMAEQELLESIIELETLKTWCQLLEGPRSTNGNINSSYIVSVTLDLFPVIKDPCFVLNVHGYRVGIWVEYTKLTLSLHGGSDLSPTGLEV